MTATELLVPSDASFFTRAQALALGESDRSLRAALRAGLVVRLRHGAYARADHLDGLDERQRHLLLARAACQQQRGKVALAGRTAALLHGFDVYGHDLGFVHLARVDRHTGRREAGVVHHVVNKAVKKRIEVVDGLPVVSAHDAVWQTALLSTLEGGVVTADCALHLRPGLVEPLCNLAKQAVAQPRSRVARLAVRLARPEAESPGESLTRVACYRNGIPCPQLQHEVFDDVGRLLGRTDFYWEEARLLGEFDGRIKYGKLLCPGSDATRVVVDEKLREDDLRATGRGMARFTWTEVQPDVAARRMARLRHQYEESRRLYVRAG
jgi:hypothetical protein